MSDLGTSPHWQSRWTVQQTGWGAGDYHRRTEIVARAGDGLTFRVAEVGGPDDPEALGIAHLMASAPELRDALNALLAFVLDACPEEVLETDEQFQVIHAASRAALGSAGTAGLRETWEVPA